ncbi:MAG: Trk family potassium uptake protein [Phascolarctobacterium sp.]|nr:Trk family potassium uptake protein [Phascolarctobacterium sp.]
MQRLVHLFFSLNRSMVILFSFAAVIMVGTVLLMLPIAHNNGQWLPFVDALFTSTSAACVTGLSVLDTGRDLSLFGQVVLIILIQIGGVGLMTVTTLFSIGLGKRINIGQRLLIQESLNQGAPEGVIRMALDILKYTFIIEFIFGTILAFYFYELLGVADKALYWGYWHAVSAFSNAGFDLLGDNASLTAFRSSLAVNLIFMALIILGGLGFTVIGDLRNKRSWRYLTLHTKIVLTVNTVLLFGGAVLFWLLEADNPATLGRLPVGQQWLASLFQSVSARTAGFNTVDISLLGGAALTLIMTLMFIGASSTSTGGGIKTTTFAVLLMSTLALLRGKKDVVIFNRRIDSSTISKSNSIFVLAQLWIVFAFFLLLAFDTNEHSYELILFELFSAFSTTGLGVGITVEWNTWCKLILIATMYIGRIGILTFSMSFFNKKVDRIRHPAENILIG